MALYNQVNGQWMFNSGGGNIPMPSGWSPNDPNSISNSALSGTPNVGGGNTPVKIDPTNPYSNVSNPAPTQPSQQSFSTPVNVTNPSVQPLTDAQLNQALTTAQNNPYTQTLQNLMTNPQAALQADPGYQFRVQQGQQALDRSAAARGLLGSGQAAIEAEQYGQGLASQQYQQALQNAMSASGLTNQQNMGLANMMLGGQGQQFSQNAGLQGQLYNMLMGSSQFGQQQQAQQFNQMLQAAQMLQGVNQDWYNRLAQLSGASTGSPASGQQAAANAGQWGWAQNQIGMNQIGQGLGALFGGSSSPTTGYGTGTYTANPTIGAVSNPYGPVNTGGIF